MYVLASGAALILAAACGGGGDKNPTGPGGDGGGNGGGNGGAGGLAGVYQLTEIGQVGVPTDVDLGACSTVTIVDGALRLDDDGTWQLSLHMTDENGQAQLDDEGDFETDGHKLTLHSDTYDDTFTGRVDAGIGTLHYDLCPDGNADVNFVFLK